MRQAIYAHGYPQRVWKTKKYFRVMQLKKPPDASHEFVVAQNGSGR